MTGLEALLLVVNLFLSIVLLHDLWKRNFGRSSEQPRLARMPLQLEVWTVFGLGEVVIQEVDLSKNVVQVVPESGPDTVVWMSLDQIRSRGVPLEQRRLGATRFERMRDRS